jgi:chromosome segregation protein
LETDTADRIAELEAEIAKLDENRPASEEAAAAERRRAEAEEVLRPRQEAEAAAAAALRRATETREAARNEAVKASERRAALAGELAAADAKLAAAAVEGDHEVLGGMIETGSGLERALSAALGERLRASVATDLGEGVRRLESAEGATRALLPGDPGDPAPGEPPTAGARRLLDLVEAEGPAAEIARRLLADAWLVDDLGELPSDFGGLAVTANGDAYDGAARELRRLPREGTDPALVARSAREELASRLRQREQTEERARRELERAEEALEATRREHDQAQVAVREARRVLDEATEEASRAGWLAERRAKQGGEESSAIQRAKLEAELTAERRHAASAEKARAAREADREQLQRRIELEREVLPAIGRTREALLDLEDALERHLAGLSEPVEEEPGGDIAAELRECSQKEYGLQGEFREASEKLTTAEVEASQLRSQREESQAELSRLAGILNEELRAAETKLSAEEREEIDVKLQRLGRRREQIGPVNPLAESEYKEAKEHVTELSEQRKDLEAAIGELRALIRRTDREIAAAFEETFEATSRNFEEMIAELFPGGRGRLRRIELGPRAVPDQGGADQAPDEEDEEEVPREDDGGVEIEVTPAGKSMRRLSLLSGGEKSLVALAFVFAVLMARPCPFYILDEVEAALDDINLDRFLRLVRRFAERSQFIVVTHQKRTMDAADVLYGISMGGDGVTKVVSRKLPREREPGAARADAAGEAAAA